jgi:predicted nucleotide-binding protein
MADFSLTDPAYSAQRLAELRSQGSTLPGFPFTGAFQAWRDEILIIIKRAYGGESEELARFKAIDFGIEENNSEIRSWKYKEGLQQAQVFLASRIDELTARGKPVTPKAAVTPQPGVSSQRRVFLVHGHNHGMKETVARFLTRLDLEPVILHEQTERGRTIIEKFEENADVPFAIALFSNDDLGVSHSEIKDAGTQLQSLLRPRARQNVVFECGYFIGRLGRERVVLLHEDGVEMMSDYSGVLYVTFDAGDVWRTKLFRELKAAGFDVDANKMF